MKRLLCGVVWLAACGGEQGPAAGAFVIAPGEGIGPARLGMRYAELAVELGEAEGAFVADRIGFARYSDLGLEVVVTSPEDALVDDALVIGIGASEGGHFQGALRPGATKGEIEAVLGPARDEVAGTVYYPEGVGIEYDGDVALRMGVFDPWERRPEVPPMTGATP